MTSSSIRESAFAKLYEWADKFVADDGIAFLILHGPPGISKSQAFKQRLGAKSVIEGKLTGVAMYEKLWELKDSPIVFDDVDALLTNKDTLNLLKLVGNTDSVKTVQWNTNSRVLSSQQIPRWFTTTSRIAIICNSINNLIGSLPAVVDRAILVEFVPTIHELHAEAGRWFQDKEVYKFIGASLAQLSTLSLRNYVKAAELKRVGIKNWQDHLLQSCGINPKQDAALQVLRDPTLHTLQQRIAKFKELCGGSKATFCRYQQELRDLHPELAAAVNLAGEEDFVTAEI